MFVEVKIFIFYIYGDRDCVVLFEENMCLFVDCFCEVGGEIMIKIVE